jgi:predicted dehydrogenase
MMQPPIRIAFSAMGDHAVRAHLQHFVRSKKCKVIGGFDPGRHSEMNGEWLQENGLDVSFIKYDSFDALLADAEADAVLIASPDRFHLPQLQGAVQAGKHVFCEKPLCTAIEELERLKLILKEAGEKQLSITSCHPRRFDPPYVWIKDNLQQLTQRYGNVLKISLDFCYHKSSELKAGLHGGSLLLDHANHEIDYVNFLLGRSGMRMTRLADGADHYALSGVRDDGVILQFHGTRRLSSRIYPETIHIRFERGELELNTYDPRLSRVVDHEHIRHEHRAPPTRNDGQHAVDHPVTDYEQRFHDLNDDWLESILGAKAGYLSAEDLLCNTALSVGFGQGSSGAIRVEKDGSILNA